MKSISAQRINFRVSLLLATLFVQTAVCAFGQRPADNTLVSLNACWQYSSPNIASTAPAFDRNNLYVAEDGGRISALSLQGGIRLWSTDLGGEIRSNIVVLGPNIYVVAGAFSDGRPTGNSSLRALSSTTGLPGLDIKVPSSDPGLLVISAGKVVELFGSGNAVAFSGDQAPAWQRQFPQIILDTAIVWNDKIAFATADSKLHVISAASGSDVYTVSTQRPVSALNIIDDDIVWGDVNGNVVKYDLRGNKVYWSFRNGGRISGLTITDDGVVAASLDDFTYLISSYYGSVRWKKRLTGRVSSITSDGKGLAVVQTVGEPNAALIDLENGKAVGQVSVGDESFTQPALFAQDRFIFFTNRQVIARSRGPCSQK